jgi:serpin B
MSQTRTTQTQEAGMKNYADAVGEFGLTLFQNLQKKTEGGNIFMSPLSIEFALNMVMNGAMGETLTAMQKALKLSGVPSAEIKAAIRSLADTSTSSENKVRLSIANSLWHDKDVKLLSTFISRNKMFEAELRGLDFRAPQSVQIINDWISKKTENMIPVMIDSIRKDMILFAINAIYFNGEWENAFDANRNTKAPFTLDNDSVENVTLMNQGGQYRYLADDAVSIVELPYGNGRYSMYVFLPKPGKKLSDLIQELDWAKCRALLSRLEKRPGDISIPVFKTSFGVVDLIPSLTDMGMRLAFTDGANFTAMSRQQKNLLIDLVLHKAVIEVSEKGTKAAAATVVGIRATSLIIDEPPPFKFVADRPFAYIIMDNASFTPIFLGKLEKPE